MVDRVEPCYIRAKAAQPVWAPFLPTPSEGTVNVAPIILQSPEFLTMEGVAAAPVRAVVAFSCTSSGQSDVLVAVDEQGKIFIVGCPDEANPDGYRVLVSDMLAANGRLWRMEYEQFSSLFQEKTGQSLEELVMPRASPDWDFDNFRPVVANTLKLGRFPILIVTTKPEGPVKEVLSYLESMNLQARPVPVMLFEEACIQVVEPQPVTRLGPPAETRIAEPPRVVPESEPEAPVITRQPESIEAEKIPESPTIPAGAMPTEPAKGVAKPPWPGTKPGVMAGKRPPPAQGRNKGGG
ncbi:MAG: hypothetical protein ABIK44_00935 [candidate division WOR-3 bacterium]